MKATGTPDLNGLSEDRFDREPFAQTLKKHILSAGEGATIALDAPWGAGKTVFLKQFAGQLRSDGWRVAYYDAFANDYEEDAFLPLVAAMHDAFFDANTKDQAAFATKAVVIGKRLLAGSARIGAKVLTAGIFDTVELQADWEKGLAAESEALGNELAARIAGGSEKQQEIADFVAALNATVEAAEGEGTPRLLVIIDEIDRCRPEFAVQTLERVKHLFEGAKCTFLFGVNIPELAAVVKGYYGEGFSGRKYLQRFFELEFGFPVVGRETPATIHMRALSTTYCDEKGISLYARQALESGGVRFEPSLRDIERIIDFNRTTNWPAALNKAEFVLLSLLVLAKISRPDDYLNLISIPPDRATWDRLFQLPALSKKFEESGAGVEDLLMVETLLENHEDKALMSDVHSSFRLIREARMKNGYPGAINLYARRYLGATENA